MDHGNQTVKGRVHGVAFDASQLSAEEAARAQSPHTPRPKVQAAGVGGAATIIIVAVLGALGVEVPEEVAAAVAAVVAFAAGYLVRD